MDFKKDVVYYFDDMIGTFHYSYGHPMKPLRVAMTDEIVRQYKLDNHFDTIDYEFAELFNIHAKE
jgi:histone deacetylase 1/2